MMIPRLDARWPLARRLRAPLRRPPLSRKRGRKTRSEQQHVSLSFASRSPSSDTPAGTVDASSCPTRECRELLPITSRNGLASFINARFETVRRSSMMPGTSVSWLTCILMCTPTSFPPVLLFDRSRSSRTSATGRSRRRQALIISAWTGGWLSILYAETIYNDRPVPSSIISPSAHPFQKQHLQLLPSRGAFTC